LRVTAAAGSETYIFENDLLLYWSTLIVSNANYLYIDLIRKAYNQILTVHSGRNKTYQFLYSCYYWLGIRSDIIRFVYNCYTCRHANVFKDKTLGFLYLLPISDKSWQHVIIDFKSFFIDKNGFDNIYIIIDYLFKQVISIFYQKTISVEKMARLYIAFIYRYYKASESMILNRRLQFILVFWKKFIWILDI